MLRALQIAAFMAVAITIVAAVHVFFWLRLVRDPALPAPWRAVSTVAMIVLAASLPLSFPLSRALPMRAAKITLFPVYTWMGIMFLLFSVLVTAEGLRIALSIGRSALGGTPPDPERRVFLARLLAGAAVAVAGGAGALAVRAGLSRIAVRELEVPLSRLPRELDGTVVVQLTDLHVGPILGRSFVEEVVSLVNALAPDLVVLTGDLADGSVARLAAVTAPLANLRARYGVFFVTGNHEYYSGADEWLAEVSRLGMRTLRNERVTIGDGRASFDLAGVDDWNADGMAPGHGHDLARAVAGRDPSRELVLLAHQPRAIYDAAHHGVGLQLSGHTHGGQLWPFSYLVRLQQPFVAGLARIRGTTLYVSRGTGFWGPPMRLGAPAEVTRIVLRAA